MIEYKLVEPIPFGSELIETLVIKPLKAKHLRNLPVDTKSMQMSHFLEILSAATNREQSIIDELSPEDLGALLNLVSKNLEVLSKKT